MALIPDRIRNPVSAGSAHRPKSSAGKKAAAKANEAKDRAVRKAIEKRNQRKIQLSKMPGGRGMEELKRMKGNDGAWKAAENRLASKDSRQGKKTRERQAQVRGMKDRGREASDKEIEAGVESINRRREAMRGKTGINVKKAKPAWVVNTKRKKS